MEPYKKLIFETEDMSVIILKLGEESNIALFFEREQDKELRLHAIRRYISNIESLIDMDEKELILKEVLVKEEELKRLNMELQIKKDNIEKMKQDYLDITIEDSKKLELEKQIKAMEQESVDLEQKISNIENDIIKLKEDIQKTI